MALTLAACGSSPATEPEPQRQALEPRGEEALEPRGEEVLDPACASSLANVPGPLALPDGVAADPRSREDVIAAAPEWRWPTEVTFALEAPRVDGDRLVLRGVIHNPTNAPQTLMLSEAGAGFFSATLVGSDLVRRAPPGPEPAETPRPVPSPEPRAFTLAPGARWTLETTVVTSCWQPVPGRAVTAHWWLHIEGSGRDGEVRVDLPS